MYIMHYVDATIDQVNYVRQQANTNKRHLIYKLPSEHPQA